MNISIKFNKKFTIATVTREFKNKMHEFGTEEYNAMLKIKQQYPGISFRVESKSIIKENRPTYAKMREYLSGKDNAATLLANMNNIMHESKIRKNPYRFVLDWFKNICPEVFQESDAVASNNESISVPEVKVA